MALEISFDPHEDDGFDDDRCRVIIDTGRFRGETRYANRSPKEFAKLVDGLSAFPLRRSLQFSWFDDLLTMRIEPTDGRGGLRLQVALSEEINLNGVSIDTGTSYVALEKIANEVARLIQRDAGTATL